MVDGENSEGNHERAVGLHMSVEPLAVMVGPHTVGPGVAAIEEHRMPAVEEHIAVAAAIVERTTEPEEIGTASLVGEAGSLAWGQYLSTLAAGSGGQAVVSELSEGSEVMVLADNDRVVTGEARPPEKQMEPAKRRMLAGEHSLVPAEMALAEEVEPADSCAPTTPSSPQYEQVRAPAEVEAIGLGGHGAEIEEQAAQESNPVGAATGLSLRAVVAEAGWWPDARCLLAEAIIPSPRA